MKAMKEVVAAVSLISGLVVVEPNGRLLILHTGLEVPSRLPIARGMRFALLCSALLCRMDWGKCGRGKICAAETSSISDWLSDPFETLPRSHSKSSTRREPL